MQRDALNDDVYAGPRQDILDTNPGRGRPDQRIRSNAARPVYTDVTITHAAYQRARDVRMGQDLKIHHERICEHAHFKDWVQIGA